jgi:hypothetical protein
LKLRRKLKTSNESTTLQDLVMNFYVKLSDGDLAAMTVKIEVMF